MRKLALILMVTISICFIAIVIRNQVAMRMEKHKVDLLQQMVEGASFERIDTFLRRTGRNLALEESRELDFSGSVIESGVSFYISGALMVKVLHQNGKVTGLDLRKVEFK